MNGPNPAEDRSTSADVSILILISVVCALARTFCAH